MTETPNILRIATAQFNPIVGDVAGNLEKAIEAIKDAGGEN